MIPIILQKIKFLFDNLTLWNNNNNSPAIKTVLWNKAAIIIKITQSNILFSYNFLLEKKNNIIANECLIILFVTKKKVENIKTNKFIYGLTLFFLK